VTPRQRLEARHVPGLAGDGQAVTWWDVIEAAAELDGGDPAEVVGGAVGPATCAARDRAAFELAKHTGCSSTEIGRALGRSAPAVRAMIARHRRRLSGPSNGSPPQEAPCGVH
jgi:hypothetical protein